jgi:molecular chaperone GrpE (heat shock protein)
MSDQHDSVRLAKWPFYLADVLLSGVIVFVLYRLGTFEGAGEMLIVGGCVGAAALAAWISIVPWLKEYEASVHLNESSNLKSSVEQIKGVEKVADLIRQSNAQWQGVQDASNRSVTAAREISERMKLEAEEFMKFLSKAHDQERAGLRLEAEKLRRMEGEWIKVTVQILDHVYALFRAGVRSGQQNLIAQLSQFQNACRDVARRIGLTPFVPEIGESFDARAHQVPDGQSAPQPGARIQDVLAPGFTYQGQMLRRSLVLPEAPASQPETELSTTQTEPGEAQEPPPPVESETAETAPYESTGENKEIASDLEVFESLGQLESSREKDEAAASAPDNAALPSPREKKKLPQDELPF